MAKRVSSKRKIRSKRIRSKRRVQSKRRVRKYSKKRYRKSHKYFSKKNRKMKTKKVGGSPYDAVMYKAKTATSSSPEPNKLNFIRRGFGRASGYKQLDEDSKERLRECLSGVDIIAALTRSISNSGYLYTPKILKQSSSLKTKSDEFVTLYNDIKPEDSSLAGPTPLYFFQKKYPAYSFTHIYFPKGASYAQSTDTMITGKSHIILIKTDDPDNLKEAFSSIVGFILGISPKILDLGKIIINGDTYPYFVFVRYNAYAGQYQGVDLWQEHGTHHDLEDGAKNMVRDDKNKKWYLIDMVDYNWVNDYYMI
jgi:hypothetical protein